MVSAHALVARLLEAEDIDWTPQPDDPDSHLSTDLPVGYVVQTRSGSFLSKYPEWDASHYTRDLHRARIFKRASTIERNWPRNSGRDFKAVPVYSRKNPSGAGPAPTRKMAFTDTYIKEAEDVDWSIDPTNPDHSLPELPERHIKIAYAHYAPNSEGDAYDRGWEDEDGHEIVIDEWDAEEGLTVAEKAARYLQSEGVTETSSSRYHPGVWYISTTEDIHDGDTIERTFHLNGFTDSEEQEIFKLVRKLALGR